MAGRVFGEDHRTGAGSLQLFAVAGVGVERDVFCSGILERTDGPHPTGSVAAHLGADAPRQLVEGERPLRHYFFPVGADFAGAGASFFFAAVFGACPFSPAPNRSL